MKYNNRFQTIDRNIDFENAYISFELYLRKITKLPEHVGVIGLFERILPHNYYVQMKTIRTFRNNTTGHGYRVGGKLPIAPQEYIDFLNKEYHWVQQNKEYVVERMLKLNNANRNHKKTNSPIEKGGKNKSFQKNETKASKTLTEKIKSSFKVVFLIVHIIALTVYSSIIVFSDLDVVSFVPNILICAVLTFVAFPCGALIIKWLDSEYVIKTYKLGTILLTIVILLNNCLLGILKAQYTFIYIWISLILIYYSILCIKECFRFAKNSFGALSLILGAFSAINGVFCTLAWSNAWMLPWNTVQWFVGLNVAIAIAFVALLIWFLDDSACLFAEGRVAVVALAVFILLNFIFLCIYKTSYQYIFLCVTFACIIFAIEVSWRTVNRHRSEHKYALMHLCELALALIFVVISLTMIL